MMGECWIASKDETKYTGLFVMVPGKFRILKCDGSVGLQVEMNLTLFGTAHMKP